MAKPGMGQRMPPLHGGALATPSAAAVAGIAFSVLFTTAYVLMRLSVPEDLGGSSEWLDERAGSIKPAGGLVPLAGIAFLWFIGVIRDRLGKQEDRFFSTVLLGSGSLFLEGRGDAHVTLLGQHFSLDSLRRDGYL